ncbi:nuclear receptor subfamily 2 group F member 1-B-like [Babylonia areolata]|uniref:nuclear receptor subfamily 2 group F member 1-B-like n=1 Tax=Babylonia areolata TaxID=304850 RepID=UPI003FD55CC4
MEVLYQPQHVFGCPPAAMVFPINGNLSQLPVPPAHMFSTSSPSHFTCYPFQTSPSPYTPSRTPTPECPPRSASQESTMSVQNGTTLQSVLRGEVPKEYAHLLKSSSSPSPSSLWNNDHHHPCPARSPSEASSSSLPAGLGAPSLSGMLGAQMSSLPVLGTASAPVLSPPPEEVQSEPMDLSCKRPSSTSSVTSSSAFHHTLPPSPFEDHQGQSSEFSLLRNLLQVGKAPPQPSPSCSSHSSSPRRDRNCDSPYFDSEVFPEGLNASTQVVLAQENLYNISARVSDWLMKTVQFATSVPCFRNDLDLQDQRILLLSSWSRLLLLFMAESDFRFSVTPVKSERRSLETECGPLPDQPTMKAVEGIRGFIGKCQKMELESEEYYYLRMLVLFNSSHVGLGEASKVEAINSDVTASLRDHVQRSCPSDVLRYSRLLLMLPALYGISDKMVERLFCRNMDSDSITEVKVLLKDLLETFSSGARP